MRESFLELVRCPRCASDRSFALDAAQRDEREVRTGTLRCRVCAHEARIEHGIVDLLFEPPPFVVREAAGLDRFADTMRADGWDREDILKLPHHESGYWYAQGVALEQTLATQPFRPGQTLLDVGSNTCWASAAFAERGLEVVALDIAAHELQGLRTADWWFADRGVFFERMLGLMFAPALATSSLDYVWCCEVLHHNHPANLRRTLRELFRVLKPGGRLLVVNEPLRTLRDPKLDPGREVAQYEGHEHAYTRVTYVRAARRAGFDVAIHGPRYLGAFRDDDLVITPAMRTRTALKAAGTHAIRRHPTLRRAYLALQSYALGEVALFMTATKPVQRRAAATMRT